MTTITIVIIAKDEEKMLPECLKTLKWADEILVIDTGSTDKTIEIAKKHKVRTIRYLTGKNFSDWRNKGLGEAKSEWLLYVDADERVPEDLKVEIQSVIQQNEAVCYAIPRRNIVLGRVLKHGGFWPDYQKRLFKKNALVKWVGEVHEEPVFSGDLLHLKSHMIHEKHETFSEMVEKTNKWSEVEAKLMFAANHPPMNIARFLTAIIREFWFRMIKGRAFLDGRVGVIFAMYQVFSRFISYAKLWERQVKNESSNI